ncbi:hypothetical protein B0H14DRAFT_3450440 [Mycena olivaceomarginata]|nr:hypothetical protein B0H14DRAFT_3450440 [Mycena olivaceomarginata]
MDSGSRSRMSKDLGATKSAYMLNPAFGYLNSQVLDKDASAPIWVPRQAKRPNESFKRLHKITWTRRGGIQHVKLESVDAKCMAVKIEKENIALVPTPVAFALPPASPRLPAKKRARVEHHAVKTEDLGASDSLLRISQLETEVALLCREVQVIRDLHDKWEGPSPRVQDWPAHHGWLSDIGSDFDPETTLPICDDGSQPVEDEYSQVSWF